MRYDLAAMARQKRKGKPRRKSVTFRPIVAPASLASDLYAAAYRPVIEVWQSAIPAIMARYERAIAEIVTDSPSDEMAASIALAESSVASVLIVLKMRLDAWGLKLGRWHRGKWRGATLTATGVDVGTLIGFGEKRSTIAATVNANVSLVKNVSDQTRARIADIVFRGVNKRTPAREVAKQIQAATGMARRRALNIASDQATKLTSALTAERRRDAGIDAWEWRHSGKLHPRLEHKARNGVRYSENPDDGRPPPSDLPGELPFCGCVELPILDLDGEF